MKRIKTLLYKLIYSQNGGLGDMISEVSLTGIAMVLIITVVLVAFSLSLSNMRAAIYKTTAQDKLIIQNNISTIDATEVLGEDVIASIRYYSKDSGVKVVVTNNHGTTTYINNSYNSNLFLIGYEDVYSIVYTRDSEGNIVQCKYKKV